MMSSNIFKGKFEKIIYIITKLILLINFFKGGKLVLKNYI